MRGRNCLLSLLLAAWLLAVPAQADVIWEPSNSFYKDHADQCELEERVYWINGPEGYVTLREAPDGRPIANVKNGSKFYVNWVWKKGNDRWGVVNCDLTGEPDKYLAVADGTEKGWQELWLPLEETVLYYDTQSFEEDHRGELSPERKTFAVADKALCFYEYPGGPLIWQMDPADTRDENNVETAVVYTDPAGREWGKVGYWYGNRNIWFCLSDLENPDLPVEDHTPDLYPAAEGEAGAVLPAYTGAGRVTAPIYAAVGLVCGVTAVLLLRMKKRKAA